MGTISKYWRHIKINSSGSRQILEIAEAKEFFTSNFPEYLTVSEVPDLKIQGQLLEWMGDNSDTNLEINYLLAERCLLCFISWQIEGVCQQLAANFGKNYGFNSRDLFPYVLTDDGRIYNKRKQTSAPSFAQEILQSFDQNQGSLATWTIRKVKQHSELNSFLLECGVYLISDWALLNDTPPKQLEKIFSSFYNFTPLETQESLNILSSYHAIYRVQRRQQRLSSSGKKCLPPTTEQLEQIAQLIETKTGKNISPKVLMTKLQNLASQLREYRIYVRSGSLPTIPLDTSKNQSLANKISVSQEKDTMDEENEFLTNYRQQFVQSLDAAIAEVTNIWIELLKGKKSPKAEQFIQALHLYHCQGKSMTEIAKNVGLKAQYQVTRLLKLKSFRADIRQKLLISLRHSILELAKDYTNPQSLKTLDKQIEIALDEQVNQVFQEAQAEGYTSSHHYTESLFAKRVCSYLDLKPRP
ncbi:MAG: hypothetical protein F6K22_33315 [Okeania sp. SIO2F4]|uniref:hypothetical protein n=1 Tax=Okeania sp. SIO2F4 TaxID=2607790 RepID=UPI00142AF90C|nr:hypothetical protein [Okeania sp. SIO2F4]NES07247.1 hypothetical protein [Okeania sp. SIO2F4]